MAWCTTFKCLGVLQAIVHSALRQCRKLENWCKQEHYLRNIHCCLGLQTCGEQKIVHILRIINDATFRPLQSCIRVATTDISSRSLPYSLNPTKWNCKILNKILSSSYCSSVLCFIIVFSQYLFTTRYLTYPALLREKLVGL